MLHPAYRPPPPLAFCTEAKVAKGGAYLRDTTVIFVLNCGYRSESPTQVFVILLHWLFENLLSIREDQWSEVIIAYDNMCQLDSLQLAKNPLPLPSPFDKMWMAV